MPATVTALPAADPKLEHLVDRVPAVVAVYNLGSGRYRYINQAVVRLLGYEPTQFLLGGVAFATSLVHPDDLAALTEKHELALARANKQAALSDKESIVSFEYRARHADGHWIWLHTEGSVYARAADGTVEDILNVSIDITKRKHAEQKLEQRSRELEKRIEQHAERLELALDASKMGTWEWNVETGELIWSPEMMRLYGLDPDKDTISYEKFFGALHPDHRAEKQQVLTTSLETGKPYQIEHRCVWPDGSEHWILGQGQAYMKDGKPYRMVGTAMNIDQRKTTEAALEASQLRYKTLFDSAIIGICVHDTRGQIHEANDKFLNMVGYSRKDADKGLLQWSSLTPSGRKDANAYKLEELLTSGEAKPWETEYLRKNGTLLPVLVGAVRIPHTKDLCVSIAIDTTEEHELMALNKTKDEFISLASHQLRTPATGVKQYVGMVLGGYAGKLTNKQQISMLESAYESNERQIKIVDNLLRVAKVDAGKVQLTKKPCDIVRLVKDVISEQQADFNQRKQSVELSAPHSLIAQIDAVYIRMVLENLISNAGKYSYDEKPIKVAVKRSGKYFSVSVQDCGVGISKSDQQKLYQKFIRVDNPLSTQAGGNGLGLYWSKKVVDLHGGKLEFISRIRSGTTFTLQLPVNVSSI